MTAKIFIDGEVGTTGLQIRARLEGRGDVQVVSLPEAERKDAAARAGMLNSADLSILCLPDDAAREAMGLIDNPGARVIDASSAHRISEGWVYGMPEFDAGQGALIAAAGRVTNPGCYAQAAVAMIHPLVSAGLLPADTPLTLNAISGYSGGGRKLIAAFEDENSPDHTDAPYRVYGLALEHKHVKEIAHHGGLTTRPLFVPSYGRFAQGMIVQMPLQLHALPSKPTPKDVQGALADHYKDSTFITVPGLQDTAAMQTLGPEDLNGPNELRLHVFGNEDRGQAVVMALLDNLGKGASGQAVQNMNLMLGLPETAGLI